MRTFLRQKVQLKTLKHKRTGCLQSVLSASFLHTPVGLRGQVGDRNISTDCLHAEHTFQRSPIIQCIWGHSPLPLMSLVDGRCGLSESIGWLCLQLDYQPSVAELFQLPPLKSGTLYQNTSSQLPRCSPSGVT